MKKYCQGFVDIISLIAVVFLVATITTVTFVTNKEDANFDIREKAVTTCLEPCVSDSECGNGYYCYKPATGCAVCKIKTPTPTITTPPTPVPTSNACISNSRCLGPGESCCGSEYFDNTCSLTETRCGNPPATKTPTSKPTTTPTPIPTIEPCSGAMQQECSERGQYCVPDDIGGHCESPTKTCEPELVQNLSCLYGKRQQNWLESNCATNIRLVSDASCIQTTTTTTANCINKPDVCNSSKGLNYCKDGIYYSKTCPNGYTCPVGGNACVATTITQSDCDKCLATNSVSECQGACGNIGNQIVNDSCTPNKNECFFGNLRTCSSSGTKGLTVCANGCDILTNTCFKLLSKGESCYHDKQCGEGNSCYTVQLTIEQRSVSICAGSQAGATLIADAKSFGNIASNPNTLIQLGIIAAAVGITQNPATAQYTQPLVNSFQNLSPSVIEFVGTLPGVYSSIKCNYNTILNQWFGNCTEQDILNQQYTAIGIQEAMNQQMIQSLAVRNNLFNTAKIIENQNSITIYKGVTLQAQDILPQADQQIFKDVIPMGSDKALNYFLNNGSTPEDIAWWQATIPGPNSPATSWTTDITVAQKYVFNQQNGGKVVSMQINPGSGISIPELAAKRGCWPSQFCINESEIVLFGKVPQSQYQTIQIVPKP